MRLLFAGTNEIGEATLRMLAAEHDLVGLLTQPDRPAGRHRELMPPAMKKLLKEIAPHVPLFQPEDLRDPSLLEALRALQPEVMVTFSYGKIIPPALLRLPTLACLNIHTSLLPRHRGASPIQASIIAGDHETGITIMYMAEGLDTGDILLAKKLCLEPRETTGTLSARLAAMAPEALQEALLLLKEGKAPRVAQDQNGVTHTHRIMRADAALDWSRPAYELERLIRAMNPKPGAHGIVSLDSLASTANGNVVPSTPCTSSASASSAESLFLKQEKKIALKIFSARAVPVSLLLEKSLRSEGLIKSSLQGSLIALDASETLLLCGEGALLLEEVQPEGGKRMSFEAFLRGR